VLAQPEMEKVTFPLVRFRPLGAGISSRESIALMLVSVMRSAQRGI